MPAKILKAAIITIGLMVLLAPSMVLGQSETREVKIQLTSTAEIDAAELFVDGVSRGFVRKGIANTIQLPLGQHSFAMRAVVNGIEYKREKSEAIVAGTTPPVGLSPSHQTGWNTPGIRNPRGSRPVDEYRRSRFGDPVY